MPELPEVETARAVIADRALHRRIVEVDDADTYECRPHAPGEIRAALLGRTLTAAHRQGKTMWCDTSGVGRSRTPGPVLGLHLGMAGRIFVSAPDGGHHSGGDPIVTGRGDLKPEWDRFTLTFADGGTLRLFDKRRLGRVRLDPDLSALGPDALTATAAELSAALGDGTAPVKARLLDQSAVAGVGNLLADQSLWQAKVHPAARVRDLSTAQRRAVGRAVHTAVRAAIRDGGVHTGRMISSRRADAHCPRCSAEMAHGTVGGRSTWWCTREQRL